MKLPLDVNRIRGDGPHERLGNSYGKVRNNGTRWHRGWDLAVGEGTPVYAVADGRIIHRYQQVKGYGKTIVLEFDNPKHDPWARMCAGLTTYAKLFAVYAHLSEMLELHQVHRGQVIGYTGITGNADAGSPHLHFEILLEDTLNASTPRVDPGEILGYSFYISEGRVGR